ncbi:MAG: FAD-dependent oxidoreductase [Candidatus Binatia bacterium]
MPRSCAAGSACRGAERAANPLVSGIYTADPERLSLAATMPRFLDLERKHRSIILGLRAGGQARSAAEQKAAGARYSLFMTHRRGMAAFVDAIAGRLPAGTVRMGAAATAPSRATEAAGASSRAAKRLAADAVVLATPARTRRPAWSSPSTRRSPATSRRSSTRRRRR